MKQPAAPQPNPIVRHWRERTVRHLLVSFGCHFDSIRPQTADVAGVQARAAQEAAEAARLQAEREAAEAKAALRLAEAARLKVRPDAERTPLNSRRSANARISGLEHSGLGCELLLEPCPPRTTVQIWFRYGAVSFADHVVRRAVHPPK